MYCLALLSYTWQLIFLRKSDCLGCAVLLCLVVCLTLLASFFLPSHLSLKHVCIYICTYYTDGNSINSSSTANGDVDGVDGVAGNGSGKAAKLSSAWCVCRWLISCMKKDEPAVGATTFQNNPHNTPEVRRHIHMHTQTHTHNTKYQSAQLHTLFQQRCCSA